MSYSALVVENITKQYTVGARGEEYHTLRDAISGLFKRPWRPSADAQEKSQFFALRDVSFEVPAGQILGIVGRNGAGKSTLLKILSRITEPTQGRVRIRGRVSSLLEVGSGFHAELTGRENLYLNGSILGMSRREIERKFDEIVAFAEVEKFIDTPVKRYSSGMYLRLAFAVAAHLEPEILIVDEVLAVGDSSFQSKCIGKMGQVANSGRTVLFVSHNMPAVQALCNRCLWLNQGHLLLDDAPDRVINEYLKDNTTEGATLDLQVHPGRARNAEVMMRHLSILNGERLPSGSIITGEAVTFRVELDLPRVIRHPRGALWLTNESGVELFTLDSNLQLDPLEELRGRAAFECHVPEMPLAPGRYTVNMSFGDTVRMYDQIERVISFDVVPGDFFGVGRMPPRRNSVFLMRSHWTGRMLDELPVSFDLGTVPK